MKQDKRRLVILGIVVILCIALVLVLLQIRNQQDIRQRAAGEAVIFSFIPETQEAGILTQFTANMLVDVKMNKTTGVDFTAHFDPSLAQMDSFQPSEAFDTVLINTINNTNGSFRFVAVNIGDAEITGTTPLGTFTFTATAEGTGELTLQNAQVTAKNIQTALPLEAVTPATYTIMNSANTNPTVSITDPLDGASIPRRGYYSITATVSDDKAIDRVSFSINGSSVCPDATESPYSCRWNVPGKPNAAYLIQATAHDTQGNSAVDTIQITTTK